MASTLDLLKRLSDHRVEYVIVGGLAGVIHGSSVVTEDVDVCAPLSRENVSKILEAMDDVHPRWRTRPDHPPLEVEPDRLEGFKNLYLVTDLGQIDFLTEITGVGDYAVVKRQVIAVELGGVSCRVLGLDALIRSKRALGRPKDLQVVVELEAIRDRVEGMDGPACAE